MRALHLVPGMNPASGGPTRSVLGLCRALPDVGVETMLYVHENLYDCDAGKCGFEKGNGLSRAAVFRDTPAIIERFKPDIIHIHALWMFQNHWDIGFARKYGIPVILSPRGALDPAALATKRWKKILGMWLYQRRDLRNVQAFHATADMEADHIRSVGFRQPIHIAPNGVMFPETMPPQTTATGARTAVFVGRIHPEKGLIELADAWGVLKKQGVLTNWRMKIVGPDDCGGFKATVVRKLETNGCLADWIFTGMKSDEEKWRELRSADLMVHPSPSENFGIAIAEGAYAGLPVIATRGTPWKILEDRKCGWWTDVGLAGITKALKAAVSLSDDQRREMGMSAHETANECFAWPAIAKKMVSAYEQVIREYKLKV